MRHGPSSLARFASLQPGNSRRSYPLSPIRFPRTQQTRMNNGNSAPQHLPRTKVLVVFFNWRFVLQPATFIERQSQVESSVIVKSLIFVGLRFSRDIRSVYLSGFSR